MFARTRFAALILAGLAIAVLAPAAPAIADDHTGTILTVAGKIGKANRGPNDAFEDAFLNAHELTFDKAYTFDREALEALGMHRIKTRYPGKDIVIDVEGPLVRDILAAVGATGDTLMVTALDGYTAELPVAEMNAYPVVLALKNNGKPLSIGGHGPGWIVYPRDDYPALGERDDAGWAWAVFFMRVE